MSIVKIGSLTLNIIVPVCYFYYDLFVKYPESNQDQENTFRNSFFLHFILSSIVLLSPLFHILTFISPSYCYKGHCPAPHHYQKSQAQICYGNKENDKIKQDLTSLKNQVPLIDNQINRLLKQKQIEMKKNLFNILSTESPNLQNDLLDKIKFNFHTPVKDRKRSDQQNERKLQTHVNQFSNLPFFSARGSRKSLSNMGNNQSPRRSSRKSLRGNSNCCSPNAQRYQAIEPLLQNNQLNSLQQINLQIMNKPSFSHSSSLKPAFPINKSIQCQFCDQCRIPKYLRMKHCYRCKKCVHKYDHHCVLLNICIGQANQKYYILFLYAHLYNTIVLMKELLIKIKLNVYLDQQTGIQHINSTYTIKAIVIILLILNFVLTAYLVFIHTQFLLNGSTTYERQRRNTINYFRHIKEEYHIYDSLQNMEKQDLETYHPFNYGWIQNVSLIMSANSKKPIDWKLPQPITVKEIPLRQLKQRKQMVKRSSNNQKYRNEKGYWGNQSYSSENNYHAEAEAGQTTTKSRDSYTMKSKQDENFKVTWRV